jgi:hypothetical protein
LRLIAAVVALLVTALAGCGGGSSPDPDGMGLRSGSGVEIDPPATPAGSAENGASNAPEAGYFASAPMAVIRIADPNACFLSLLSALDLDGDGRKDLAIHGWCNQWGLPAGFDGPTPDAFHAYLNRQTGFEPGNRTVFGRDSMSLGGASRKVSVADLNGDGRLDLAYAINREDGRPIGDNVGVAAA